MSGTLTEADKVFVETWESVSNEQNFVYRLNARGEEIPLPVQGHRRFTLSTAERLLTQEKIADVKYDPFVNGAFRPIVVPETVNVETNPNALSDEDIQRIFTSSDTAWEEYMKVITSPATLHRMVDLADNAEISLKRFRELEDRLKDVAPPRRIVQKDQATYDKMDSEPTSTPKRR